MKNLYVILVRPQVPENIGFSIRVCANFKVENLFIVAPENFDMNRIKRTATQIGSKLIDKMRLFGKLEEATKDMQYIIGTTARTGTQRKVYYTLDERASYIAGLSQINKVAILMGNERTGLTNEELLMCDEVITIPTEASSSLNLSHALAIILYEVYKKSSAPVKLEKPKIISPEKKKRILDLTIETIKLLDYIPHNNEVLWKRNVKEIIDKFIFSERDAKIIMGFMRAIQKKIKDHGSKNSK